MMMLILKSYKFNAKNIFYEIKGMNRSNEFDISYHIERKYDKVSNAKRDCYKSIKQDQCKIVQNDNHLI